MTRKMAAMKMDPRSYYDAFSAGYDTRRHAGYHAMLDVMESDLVLRYCAGRHVLDAGCGTGLILNRVESELRSVVGMDLSMGMLNKAQSRPVSTARRLVQGSLTDLPFADASFDAAYSFKVLAHIPDIQQAVQELARVVRPGGHLILEFYNPLSVRGLLWKVKRPGQIAGAVDESQVFTRFDRPGQIRSYFPKDWQIVDSRGIRILTPAAQVMTWPYVGKLLERAEHQLADSPLRGLGSFYCVVAQRGSDKPCCDDSPQLDGLNS